MNEDDAIAGQHGVDVAQLDAAYASGGDPWRIGQGFYERRKRALVLDALPRERFESAFEPGCAEGELTVELAGRCRHLLAADYHADAVAATTRRVAGLPGCTVAQLLLPAQWPEAQRFDLVVISELGYYLSAPAWSELCRRLAAGLGPSATVLACHWRHDFAGRTLSTDELHAALDRTVQARRCTRIIDDDFLLDVWTTEANSPAQREGRR
jgi:16S rRNA A1518/A1519 N6-dimethyltransferase RsmA/KsgA/DIM1 with predicted DNA glycosylase/AP lyase activity